MESLNNASQFSDDNLSARSTHLIKSTEVQDDSGFVKNIYVHRNGDLFSSARRFVYNKKQLRTWDAFLEHLTQAFQPRTGPIRDIYTPRGGTRVIDFEDIQPNTNYVAVAGGEKLQLLGYLTLSKEMEAAKKRRNYQCQSDISPEVSQPILIHKRLEVSGRIKYALQKRGKLIHVFRNGDEYTRAISVLLKPYEQTSMDYVLRAIAEKVILPTSVPIRRLWTMEGEPITDPEQLEDNKSYVATGMESFISCVYAKSLPQIIFGSKKPERIRYLHSVTTPIAGRGRNNIKSHSIESITPKTSRQTYSNDRSPRHKVVSNGSPQFERNSLKPQRKVIKNGEIEKPIYYQSENDVSYRNWEKESVSQIDDKKTEPASSDVYQSYDQVDNLPAQNQQNGYSEVTQQEDNQTEREGDTSYQDLFVDTREQQSETEENGYSREEVENRYNREEEEEIPNEYTYEVEKQPSENEDENIISDLYAD